MDSDDQEDDAIIPMPQEENIDTLRAKLHAKIDAFRNKGKKAANGEVGSKDELLESGDCSGSNARAAAEGN